jgi:hypothetical protein
MNLKTVLLEINAMEADGIIDRYAIGGAVGATFYLEPVATLDVDIFISFQAQLGSLLMSPEPVFTSLTERGARIEGEYLIIADWLFNFYRLPDRWWKRRLRKPWKLMLRK